LRAEIETEGLQSAPSRKKKGGKRKQTRRYGRTAHHRSELSYYIKKPGGKQKKPEICINNVNCVKEKSEAIETLCRTKG